MPNYNYKPIDQLNENMDNLDQKWFKPKIDLKLLKELSKRRDGPGWINTISYFVVLFVTGYLSYLSWGSWWALPAFFAYGTVSAFAAARWHEYGHRSVFRTRWLNDFFYEISSFICYFEPVSWRWSHTHHHSRTIHVGIDYEIAVPPNSKLINVFLWDLLSLRRYYYESKKILYHSLGIMTQVAKDCVPEYQRSRMIWTSRLFVLITLGTLYWAYSIGSFLPLFLIFTPSVYGWPLLHLCGLLQHAGLKSNSWDHRESARTFLCGPILGWLLYFNMQYHLEHHIFPQVPFYNLPKLHQIVKDQLPPPNPSFIAGLKEMIPAVIKQTRDPNYFLQKKSSV